MHGVDVTVSNDEAFEGAFVLDFAFGRQIHFSFSVDFDLPWRGR